MKPTQEEIYELLNKCVEAEARGLSAFPGMTYEQGIQDGIRWVIGEDDQNPLEDADYEGEEED